MDEELQPVLKYYQGSSIESGLVADADGFHLNNKNLTIFSGALHYFRVHPSYWEDRIAKISALGLVAVETYVPWNLHEPEEGVYDFGDGDREFSAFLNLDLFIQKVYEANLLMLIRPGPYICAEWEFGGLPSWLLRTSGIKVRTSDEKYTSKVKAYYDKLLPIIAKWQFIKGGPIIAVQLENEYGSTGVVDKEYLTFLRDLYLSHGIEGLFYTSDSPLSSGDRGSLEGALQTANFQVNPEDQLNRLKELQPDKPAMVMEYWSGWFDHWMESSHSTTSVESFRDVLERIITFPASFNLYMFHGGTSFGFMNGANIADTFPTYTPDVTSYDYDAPLSEAGDYTEKYTAVKELLEQYAPRQFLKADAPKESDKVAYADVPLLGQLTLDEIVAQVDAGDWVNSTEILPMEYLDINNGNGQSYGFVLYRKTGVTIGESSVLQIIGRVRDLAIVLIDGESKTDPLTSVIQLEGFGFWEQSNASTTLNADGSVPHTLDILVENWGRNNFGSLLNDKDFDQRKGIVSGPVLVNGTALSDWQIFALQFKKKWLQRLTGWQPISEESVRGPVLIRATFNVDSTPQDTFIDMSAWGKGSVFLNGFPLGRYFNLGPQRTLYVPAPLLIQGENEILIFELYTSASKVVFSDVPILG
ncbi:beta-galactosidase-1-like protein 2 [Schistocerca americana]|uniref:beta-galactosidase-1-like protein 2 n=1 Tax=Schistocerca americana TaxID=7009 RepID=UPI001F4FBE91|nr:beta-galactosidase-1-like protein 2 [Schistocerca americana]XP_049939912.1 beta-galactosidase-1-like protein 2 isoform X2 [Schistocerca serialis cubense]